MMRRVTGTVARTGRAVCARSWVRLAAPAAWLSAGGAKEWTSVTNSSTKFDPRQFMQSEGPHDDGDVASLRRALLYRSRQTGWLETDLIMGRWAAENLDKLSIDELKEYAKIVKCEILDIFQWINGQLEVPAEVDGPIMKQLQEYAIKCPPAPVPGSYTHSLKK
mmetsp:Transcript_92712/g.135497  ORF Transcript_92712/g.135497 Transcript_92712/m.135497 type:complete len:164 (+) Transcript_92712:58-549(+)